MCHEEARRKPVTDIADEIGRVPPRELEKHVGDGFPEIRCCGRGGEAEEEGRDGIGFSERLVALFVGWEEATTYVGFYCLRCEVVDATDQRYERRRESFQFLFLVRAYSSVEDGDEAVCIGLGIEEWEERVVGESAGFLVL